MATKRKEPESQRISWFLYSFEEMLNLNVIAFPLKTNAN